MFKKVICESVEAIPVSEEAIEIITPFIDWKGCPVSIFVTKEGNITDGNETINQLKSLRVIDEFEEWLFQEDYFSRYQIQKIGDSLEPTNPESPDALLSYIQGIARIPGFFRFKPISSKADYYPTIAIEFTKEGLIEKYQLSAQQALNYLTPRRIDLKFGLIVINDMSPKKENRLFKIISHATGTTTDKRQHVRSKVLDPVLWMQENPDIHFYAILENINEYPRDSQELLKQKADDIIETRIPESKFELANLLFE